MKYVIVKLIENKFYISVRNFENPTLEVIYIYNCKVDDIQPRAFESIPKFKHVYITGNAISTIRKGVFTNLNLINVYLRKNKIKYVESEAFFGMSNLKFLSLEENELTYFDPSLVIGPTPSLTRLYINRNQLTEVKRNMFSIIPNLEILLLNINQLEILGGKVFVDLKKLWLLDLSHNLIDEVRSDIFSPEGNSIVKLFLHDNRLTFISSGVLVRLQKLQQISATGNPWQCPCQLHFRKWLYSQNITRICDREVKDGERPSCVIHPDNYKECVYDKENSREVVEYYEQVIKEYPQLPPVCETDNKEVPSLGAK